MLRSSATFSGAAPAGEALAWRPGRAGRFVLSVVDDHGRQDAREIEVRQAQ